MRKKILIIPILVIALVAFGKAPSAHAFVGIAAISGIIAAAFFTPVAVSEGIKHSKAESAQKKAKKQSVEKKTKDDMQVSGLKTQMAAEAH